MAMISATESLTLDGVLQGLGRPDEDTRGDFVHGGWGNGFQDHISAEFMSEGMGGEGAMLFGRRTYEDLLAHWTQATEPNPFTDYLTSVPKFVTSRSADVSPAYPNSTLLVGEATQTVARLKTELSGDLTIIGSGELVRALHSAGLIDQYVLQIHPIILGSGTRLFADGDRSDLELERSVVTTTGVVIAQYAVRRP